MILKSQERFKNEKNIIFTKQIDKIAFSSNDDKRMQSIDSIETNAYETNKDLVSQKEMIKCNDIKKQYRNG